MKTKKERALFWYPLIGSILLFTFLGCNKISSNTQTREINVAQQNDGGQDVTGEEVIWHVKAVHPDGKLLDVKALDDNGHVYDIKSIQYTDQISLMDVKAFVNDKIVPVKVLVSDEELLPVKAILEDGTVLDVKAIPARISRLISSMTDCRS